jgi:hypothetical protein
MQTFLVFLLPPGHGLFAGLLVFLAQAKSLMAGFGALDIGIVALCFLLTGIMLVSAPGSLRMPVTGHRWQAMLRGAYQSGLRIGGEWLALVQGISFGLAAVALILILRALS